MADKYNPLAGKKIVVIGGTSGIGYGGAEASLARQAIVFVASSGKAKVDAAVAKLQAAFPDGKVYGGVADMKDEDSVKAFFDFVNATGSKGVDHIIYSAGDALAHGTAASAKIGPETTGAAYDVRVFGIMRVVKVAKEYFNPGGSLVLTSGTAALKPVRGWASSAAVTGAVVSLSKGLAVDLAPFRVNCVTPGAIITPLWDTLSQEGRDAMFKFFLERHLTKTMGQPEDVAQAFLYLMSSRFTTGTVTVVDGGFLLT